MVILALWLACIVFGLLFFHGAAVLSGDDNEQR